MSLPDKEWVVVYRTTHPHKVNIVKAVLEDNSIDSVEVNKKDSAYPLIGDIELFVHSKDETLSKFLIKENSL